MLQVEFPTVHVTLRTVLYETLERFRTKQMHTVILWYDGLRNCFVTMRSADRKGQLAHRTMVLH